MIADDAKLVADVLVNLLGAAGLLLVAHNMRHYGPRAPVVFRIRWALRLCAFLFFARAIAWGTANGFLLGFINVIAAVMPIAALIVAEGLVRRHAPKGLKIGIVTVSLITALVVIVPGIPAAVANLFMLFAVVGGFAAVGYFLFCRQRDTLSDAENKAVSRVIVAMLLLVPLAATDFHSIWPDIPVRLGALGMLLMVYIAFGPGNTIGRGWERALSLMVFAAIAGVFAFGYVVSGRSEDPGQLFRAAAVGVSGLIFAALFSELLGARAERRKTADPILQAATADEFVDRLKQHDLIGDARILDAPELKSLEHPDFASLVAAHPVLRQADAPWQRDKTDDGVERAASLLATYEATHAMRLSAKPLRLAVFSLPPAAADARIESELQAAQRIGELVFQAGTTS